MKRRWGGALAAAFLLMTLGTGVAMILAATGVIPSDDRDFGAPRWIVVVLGAVLVAMGLYPVLASRATGAQRGLLGGAFALVFLTAASVFLTWAALTGAAGRSALRVGGAPVPLPEPVQSMLGRVFVVFCAALMDTITVVGWWAMGRHLWRGRPRDSSRP